MSTVFTSPLSEDIGTPVPQRQLRRMHNPYAVTPSMSPSLTGEDLTPSNLSFALMPASIVTPVASPVLPPAHQAHSSLYQAMTAPVVPMAASLAPTPLANTPPPSALAAPGAFAELMTRAGELRALARCGTGSSFLQAAAREDPRCAAFIWQELLPEMGELLLDPHGGYVVKSLLERVPREDARGFTDSLSLDERLAMALCTHSLHTRRLVQVIMESVDPNFLCNILTTRCAEVARTQQGCIVLQRAMDHTTGKQREALFAAVRANIAGFALDPFANYVVQYYLDSLPREETGPAVWAAIQGRVLELSCNKFASNVLEKFLLVADASAQHELIRELYSAGDHALYSLMQDSFGNYIIQASIARATFADVMFINEKLRPVLDHVPYGSKIIMRLDRRLRDRSGSPSGNSPQPHGSPVQQQLAGPSPFAGQQQRGPRSGGFVPRHNHNNGGAPRSHGNHRQPAMPMGGVPQPMGLALPMQRIPEGERTW